MITRNVGKFQGNVRKNCSNTSRIFHYILIKKIQIKNYFEETLVHLRLEMVYSLLTQNEWKWMRFDLITPPNIKLWTMWTIIDFNVHTIDTVMLQENWILFHFFMKRSAVDAMNENIKI